MHNMLLGSFVLMVAIVILVYTILQWRQGRPCPDRSTTTTTESQPDVVKLKPFGSYTCRTLSLKINSDVFKGANEDELFRVTTVVSLNHTAQKSPTTVETVSSDDKVDGSGSSTDMPNIVS